MIRDEIYNFVHIWNHHRIRAQQKKRPNLPTGKPSVLYFTPPEGIRNYGLVPNTNTLRMLQAEVAAWGKVLLLPNRSCSPLNSTTIPILVPQWFDSSGAGSVPGGRVSTKNSLYLIHSDA